MCIESAIPSNHLILCRPLLLPPSIFPSIRVFSNESALGIRWPKYWSFSFSISPSSECSGLISFRMDWSDPLAVWGALKTLLQHHSWKASIPQCSDFFMVQLLGLRKFSLPENWVCFFLPGFSGGSVVKNLPSKQETQIRSPSQEDPLEEEMAAQPSILAWRIPWTEEPGGLQSTGHKKVGHNWSDWTAAAEAFPPSFLSTLLHSCPLRLPPSYSLLAPLPILNLLSLEMYLFSLIFKTPGHFAH